MKGIPEITGNLTPEEALSLLEKIDELTDKEVNAVLEKISTTQVGEENG